MARLQQKRVGKCRGEKINAKEMREALGKVLESRETPEQRANNPFNARWRKRETRSS
jgi:hypothetical protein